MIKIIFVGYLYKLLSEIMFGVVKQAPKIVYRPKSFPFIDGTQKVTKNKQNSKSCDFFFFFNFPSSVTHYSNINTIENIYIYIDR